MGNEKQQGGRKMPLLKDVKEQEELRKKRNLVRIITWISIAVVLFILWYVI